MAANALMKILKNILLLLATVVLSLITADLVGGWYKGLFNPFHGFSSFIVSPSQAQFFDGLFPSYLFFLTLLFVAFGDRYKYWWIGVAGTPIILFLISPLSEFYFHLLFPIAGWLIGRGIKVLVRKQA